LNEHLQKIYNSKGKNKKADVKQPLLIRTSFWV